MTPLFVRTVRFSTSLTASSPAPGLWHATYGSPLQTSASDPTWREATSICGRHFTHFRRKGFETAAELRPGASVCTRCRASLAQAGIVLA